MADLSYPPAVAAPALPAGPRRYPWYHWRRLGFNFLTISVAAHLLFGVGATYLIVQTIQGKRKQTFSGPPQSPNAPTRAIEHKVQMQKKQQTMSAPAPVKRITTTSNTKIALPAMPAMPKMDQAITPMAMAGMGGTGMGLSMGAGGAGAPSGGGGSGSPLSLFGVRESKGGTLVGTLFDFKQTPDQRATNIGKAGGDGGAYTQAITAFVQGGMNDSSVLGKYFKGPNPLYATQLFIPLIDANEGPKAFNVQGRVQPSHFMVHYRGLVVPPESGTYHFVGFGDDVLVVNFNHQLALDCGIFSPTGRAPSRFYMTEGLPTTYSGAFWHGLGEGNGISVEAGQSYPIDIVISEWGGGDSAFYLLMRKDGVEYKKDSKGNPILPLFRLADGRLPNHGKDTAPVYQQDGPIWKAIAPPAAVP